jgi:glycosyltransferase involved in cell wall biosynthesis
VRVLPRQPRSRIGAFLTLADVLVSPRCYGDNLPLKIFDYMASGRAIVATDLPTHRCVLDDTRAQLVEPSAAGLARGIVELLLDPALAAQLGAEAQEHASGRGARKRFVEMVAELYDEAFERANAAPTSGVPGQTAKV